MAPKIRVGRNALCPCGSGKKFKQCCEGKTPHGSDKRSATAGLAIILVAVLTLAVVLEISRSGGSLALTGTADAAAVGAPWEYDAVNNRHWDPGHGHWHDGPPPAGLTPPTAATQPGPTPEPWEHDAANDRHWDPGHGHWHPGPPPPPQAR